MMLRLWIFLFTFYGIQCGLFYDSYHGTPITREELKQHDKSNRTFWCVNEIEPCDPYEGRRSDGSCNNLQNPTRGASHTPLRNVLPTSFIDGDEPRKAKSGNDMPLPRYLRTQFLAEGHVPSNVFSYLSTYGWALLSSDIASLHDTVNYIVWKPYCCTPKGKTDRECIPIKVPDDDPVHRFSDIRCLNLTRPETFQSKGCLKNHPHPSRIVSSTPLIDLSAIYGSGSKSLLLKGRQFEGGLLKVEVSNGRIWPPSYKTQNNVCLLNQKPRETRCHLTPEDGPNTLASINLIAVWFWRQHNMIAQNLARINPCWGDELLFITAKDINLAIAQQIMFYELLPAWMGRDNLIREQVISPSPGFRNIYNPKILPQLSLEFPYVLRWLHTIQDGAVKMYDKHGMYIRQYPIVNLTLRTGFFDVDDNIDYMTQGSFRQSCAAVDYIVDPDLAEIALGPHQRAADLMSTDLTKNRYFGFQPYVKYRQFCFGENIRTWDDLRGIVDPERIELMKSAYESVEDVDLLVGIWLEKLIPGGHVPPTFYCLVVEQLVWNIKSDRHWYENSERPNAFTLDQLYEIRKATIARTLCDVGDTVTEIQPQAFFKIGPGNPLISCDYISSIDYRAWTDERCINPELWSKTDNYKEKREETVTVKSN